jgi:hypothetical protein
MREQNRSKNLRENMKIVNGNGEPDESGATNCSLDTKVTWLRSFGGGGGKEPAGRSEK